MEVKNDSDQLIERSSLLVGLEEGMSVMVALIMLPINMQSYQHQTLQRFVEMATERAKTNGSCKLQIVCARKSTAREEEERAEEEGIREVLLSLPQGSCTIPSAQSRRVNVLASCCAQYSYFKLAFMTANVRFDMEGREILENLKLTKEDEISANVVEEPPPFEINKAENNSIDNFIKSIWAKQSERAAGESKTREFMEALKGSGMDYLLIHNTNNTSQMVVDDLHRKAIGLFICNFEFLQFIKLQQISKHLQEKDSGFIWIWIPTGLFKPYGHGSFTRFMQCMQWATFPDPQLVIVQHRKPCFVVLDKHGQIANHGELPLLLAWDVNSYPFTSHTTPESLSLMDSESCLEFLLHGMDIVGRKQMKSKMTFLYVAYPAARLWMNWKLEELNQIHGSFEVLYVGKLLFEEHMYDIEIVKQDYEEVTQTMRWPSLSFSDMITFWDRCQYLADEEAYLLYKDSNIMMESLHGLAKYLCGLDDRDCLALVDNDGVVTCGGYEVVQMICESSDEFWEGEGEGMRMVKDELMKSLSRGECSPLVRTFFRDEIHNLPQHPQHPISVYPTPGCHTCDVCWIWMVNVEGRSYRCVGCDWDMCGSCWMAYAKQQRQQLLCAKEN